MNFKEEPNACLRCGGELILDCEHPEQGVIIKNVECNLCGAEFELIYKIEFIEGYEV